MRRGDSVRNAVERTLEYSRPLRSLKLWLAFRTHGAAAFRAWIEQTLALARRLAAEVADDADVRAALRADALDGLLPPPPGRRASTSTPTTRALAAAAQRDGRVYLASAIVDGRVCLRVCFVNFRTRPEDVDFALETLRELGARLTPGVSRSGIRLMPLKKFDCRRSGSPVSSKLATRRTISSKTISISSRARWAPVQKWGPPGPKVICGFGSRPTSNA